jgi:hypothetical protein
MGTVTAIEKNLEERADMDEATRDAQTLWLATVALNLALQVSILFYDDFFSSENLLSNSKVNK